MVSAIETFLASFLPDSANAYQLAATLDGHEGPINAFSFNTDSTLLASGGVHLSSVWFTKNKCYQEMMKKLEFGT